MSPTQIRIIYGSIDRDDSGYPKLEQPLGNPPSYFELFKRQCFLVGVYEPDTVKKLFAEHNQKMKERIKKENELAKERKLKYRQKQHTARKKRSNDN
jgi:hypothetical protein